MSDPKQVVEQIASEADATADQPMPPGALSTRPNKSVTVATRLSPEDLAEIERLSRPPGRTAVQPHPRMDPLRPQRAQGRDRAEHHRENLRRRPATPRTRSLTGPARTADPGAPITPTNVSVGSYAHAEYSALSARMLMHRASCSLAASSLAKA